MERKKRMLTGLAATGVLAGALAGGGVLVAGASGSSQPAALTAAASTSSAAFPAIAARAGAHPRAARYLRRHHAGRLVLRTAASYLGITPAELGTDLHAGKSLSAVATSRGKSVSGLESALVSAVTKRVDASKLTAARKTAVIADVKANVNAFVTATHPFEKAAHRLGHAAKAGTPAASGAATAA